MKKKSTILLTVILLVSSLLGGCGNALYELTDEEEELIVQYAAYTLGKYNSYQKDGLTDVSWYSPEEEAEPEYEENEEELLEEETSEEPEGENPTAVTPAGNTTLGEEVTLAAAIGYEGQLDVLYQGCYTTDSYMEGNHYAVNAKSGNTFVVMEFTMENNTEEAVSVDVLELGPTFRLSADKTSWVNEDVTLLLYDLSTYQGTIAAGEQVEVVLLFEIPAADEEALSDILLAVVSNGVTNPVKL